MTLATRTWLPDAATQRIAEITARLPLADPTAEIERLAAVNLETHDRVAINLNPATNIMNPRAEALLAAGLGSRASLGYPGDKYEMGLEAIEEIEVITADLAARVFDAAHVEFRMPSGAIANLATFMATCQAGDAIIVPPAAIGGHVTHHAPGAAGLFGLSIHEAPVAANAYTVDVDGVAALAGKVRPKLITIGGSLNLEPHAVAALAEIAHGVGARLLFDAAHLSGMIAGRAWPNPLDQGADLITMSTYKSLGGPPAGLIVTRDADLAARIEAIAFPGLTANFDVARTAALGVTLADWQAHGAGYAAEMVATARTLAAALSAERVPVYLPEEIATRSHQFALRADRHGGGQAMARRLRRANVLTSGIGLPLPAVDGDANGLRMGTPEIVRRGMTSADMGTLAELIGRALSGPPETVAAEMSAFRQRFPGHHHMTV